MSNAVFVRPDESREARGKQSLRNYYFGENRSAAPGPEGFLLEFVPSAGLPAHFHDVNQFQVFFGSDGATFGHHQIPPLMVHYAGAGTLYGPFAAGGEPLRVLTLRQNGNNFTGLLPEDRDKLAPPGVRKHFECAVDDWLSAPLPGEGQSLLEVISPLEDDGPIAFALTAGPDARIVGPPASDGSGQYYVIIEGELRLDGRVLPGLTIGWCPADAEAPTLVAGEAGARFLVLQFAAQS